MLHPQPDCRPWAGAGTVRAVQSARSASRRRRRTTLSLGFGVGLTSGATRDPAGESVTYFRMTTMYSLAIGSRTTDTMSRPS